MKTIKRLEAVTVCVNYADFLAESIPINRPHLDHWVIVTSHEDKATQKVCREHAIECVVTDSFTDRGDVFNKARGINLGLAHSYHDDWLIHLDADVVLPNHFRQLLYRSYLDTRCLYGADRLNVIGYENWEKIKRAALHQYRAHYLLHFPPLPLGARLVHDQYGYCPIGFFQMWHSSTGRRYPCNQRAAEHTDVLFALQWPLEFRRLLSSLAVFHLESEPTPMGANWNGRKTKPFGPTPKPVPVPVPQPYTKH